jgi:hypothetical protein
METQLPSLIQMIADRIVDHLESSDMLTREQENECWTMGLQTGTERYLELVRAYQVRRFAGKTEEEMIEILVETVKDYARNQAEQERAEYEAGEDL